MINEFFKTVDRRGRVVPQDASPRSLYNASIRLDMIAEQLRHAERELRAVRRVLGDDEGEGCLAFRLLDDKVVAKVKKARAEMASVRLVCGLEMERLERGEECAGADSHATPPRRTRFPKRSALVETARVPGSPDVDERNE